jgi:hypothetical protein
VRGLVIVAIAGLVACGGRGEGILPDRSCEQTRVPTQSELPDIGDLPSTSKGREAVLKLDLDGDRKPDELVTSEELCTSQGNCAFAVFLKRGECGYFMGALWAKKVRVSSAASGTIGDLIATTSIGNDVFEELYQYRDDTFVCMASRTQRTYVAGRLQPFPRWSEWTACIE